MNPLLLDKQLRRRPGGALPVLPDLVENPLWANTVLLLRFDDAAGELIATDESASAHVMTTALTGQNIVNDVARFGPGSMRITNGNVTTVTGLSDFDFGTGDFTVECWHRVSVGPQNGNILARNSADVFGICTLHTIAPSNGSIVFRQGTTNRILSGFVPVIGEWMHIALSRVSGITRLFINGIQRGSNYTDANNYTGTTSFVVAGTPTGASNGHYDEVRVLKGVGLYAANFTPPDSFFPAQYDVTWPAPVATAVSLPASLDYDEPVSVSYSYSGSFPESGTRVVWYRADSLAGANEIIVGIGPSYQLTANDVLKYISAAVVPRDGYQNGTPVRTERVLLDNGPNPLWENIALLLRFDDALESSTFADESQYGHTISVVGTPPTIIDHPKRFGSGALQKGPAENTLVIYSANAFNFGTGDFTLDFMLRRTAGGGNSMLWTQGNANSSIGFTLYLDPVGTLLMYMAGNVRMAEAGQPVVNLNQWTHVRLSRVGGWFRKYINGVQAGTAYYNAGDLYDIGGGVSFLGNGSTGQFSGQVDEIRVLRGVGIHTAGDTQLARWNAQFVTFIDPEPEPPPPPPPPEVMGVPTATSWRMYITQHNQPDPTSASYVTVCEIKFYDAADNLLTVSTISASTIANEGNAAALAIDNNIGSKWTSALVAPPHWLRVDFAAPQTVAKIKVIGVIDGQQALGPRAFKFQSLDTATSLWGRVGDEQTGITWTAGQEREFIIQ
jgi:hypothetical protein